MKFEKSEAGMRLDDRSPLHAEPARTLAGRRRGVAQSWCGVAVLLASLLVVGYGSYARAGGATLGPAAGQLDRSFGTDGKVITDLGRSEVTGAAVATPDGKIVVAAGLQDLAPGAASRMLVARYLPDGRLDQGFGSGGTTAIGFGGRGSWANALALQPDGKIVLGGGIAGADAAADFALLRVAPDGSLDTSFGTGGKVTTDLAGTVDVAVAVALQPDARIVVAGGTRSPGNPYDFALARYNPDGSLDTDFGTGGHTSTHFDGGNDAATGVALQPDGKIVVVGTRYNLAEPTRESALTLARYRANGTLDSTFGGDGRVIVADAVGSDVAVVQGKIVVGGALTSGRLALWRYNTDGTPDPTFGRGGLATAFGSEKAAAAFAIAVQPDGEIVAAGGASVRGGDSDFAVARFNPNGRPDPAFGSAGTQTTNLRGASTEFATGLALTRSGKIVLAGITVAGPSSQNDDIALARYYGRVCVVPTVLKRPLLTARAAITKAQCAVGNVRQAFSTRVNKGRVVSQKPTAGTRQRLGAPVALVVSKGRRGH